MNRRLIVLALSTFAVLIGGPVTAASAGGTGPTPAPVICSQLPAPHMTEQCNNFVAPAAPIRSLTIVISKNKITVDGTATDQIASFYRSKSGRTLRLTFRAKPTFIVAQYAYVKAVSSDGYGEDVFSMKAKAGQLNYSFVSPRKTYVQFLYAEFAPVSQGLGSASGSPCLNGCG